MTEIRLSVLVTREEYAESAVLLRRKAAGRITAAMVFGAVLTAAGIAGLFFGGMIGLTVPAAICLIVPGIILILYDAVFAPMLGRISAINEFNENAELRLASSYIFTDEYVEVHNARFEGKLSYTLVSEWTETPTLFLIRFGTELQLTVPKRIMNSGEIEQLRSLRHG